MRQGVGIFSDRVSLNKAVMRKYGRRMITKYVVTCSVLYLLAGCGKAYNLDRASIDTKSRNRFGTYSDYSGEIELSKKKGLHRYTIYVGGISACDDGVVLYAKPKLDDFMSRNNFDSYVVVNGEYKALPFSRCVLFIQFK